MKADIVERLRAWVHTVKAVLASDIMDEAAAEIERLRNGSLVACETVRLTDAEREAIAEAAGAYNDNDDDEECAKIAATLHGLLKRLG
jgi:3-phosphoglycerate kinase